MSKMKSKQLSVVPGEIHLVWSFERKYGSQRLVLRFDKCEIFRGANLAEIQRAEDEDGIEIKEKYWCYGIDMRDPREESVCLPETDRLDLAMKICEDFVIAGVQ